MTRCALIACLLSFVPASLAQAPEPANAVLLVAKPGMADPRFSETVVLVTQTEDAQTVGVILNRPLAVKLSQLVSDASLTRNYKQPVFFGGPVLERTLLALFHSEEQPAAPAFHMLKGVYLSMHPQNVERLLRERSSGYRIYSGFSGWAPRQLEGELAADGWYVIAAREEFLFRADTSGLWQELLEKARGKRAALYSLP